MNKDQNDTKIPLVLIPGLTDDEYLWRHQVKFLADVATPVVANVTQYETVTELAQSVLDMAPERFALAGFSLGGYVSLEIMRRHPERVLKLALLGTSARADTPERRKQRHEHMAVAQSPARFREFIRSDLPAVIHPDRLSDDGFSAALVDMAMRVGTEAFVRQHLAAMGRPNSLPDLARISCPTVILCGRQDAITTPEMSSELARGITNSRLVFVEDSGHYIPLEQPQAVTALLREWLVYAGA